MITAAALALLLSALQARPEKLPDDEEKLYKYALDHAVESEGHRDAERACREFIGKFPASPRLEKILSTLARLKHYGASDCVESRRLYARLLEQFPRSEEYWTYRLQSAETWLTQGLWGRALDAYREIANETKNPSYRSQAVRGTWKVTGKELYLDVGRTFTTGETAEVRLSMVGLDKLTFRDYLIRYDAVLPHLDAISGIDLKGALDKVAPESRRLVKEWTATFQDRQSYKPIELPSSESGVHIVEVEAEGVVQSATLLVGRYGIIAKTSAEKLVCLAQDRMTSRPVPGAVIRVKNGDRNFLGATDEQGLFVTRGYLGGLVVGQHDGELFLAAPRISGQGLPDALVYIVTDRPIYRPNQTVHFRVVHRDERGRELAPRPGLKVRIWITYDYSNEVFRTSATLNEFGSAEGEFPLGDSPFLGEYTIYCEPDASERSAHGEVWTEDYRLHVNNHGSFRVDEYRKPEFRVQVDFKKPTYVKGDAVQAEGKAEYYFGGPVVEAEFEYRVHFRQTGSSWYPWAWYYDWYCEDDDESRRPQAGDWLGDEVGNGTGKTDKDGKFSIDFGPLIEREEDGIYTVVVEVTDLSRRVVTGAGSCRAAKAEVVLATTLNKNVFRSGDEIVAKVRARTLDDKAVPNARILLRAYDQHWNGEAWDRKQVYEAASTTDALGLANFSCTPDLRQGYLLLEAELLDSKGRRATSNAYAWLSGPEGWNDPGNWNDLEIVLDKKTYEVGDTARILVASRFKDVALLCTIEGSEIYQQRVVRLKGHTALLEVPLDRADFAPNVHVVFAGLRDRTVVLSSRSLVINPSKRFVTVEIRPDQSEYRPRQKARYEIRTSGADGKPAAAEVMVGIVDDSIYALQDEYIADIRKHFLHKREPEVAMSTTLRYNDQPFFGNGWGRGGGFALTGASFTLNEPKMQQAVAVEKSDVRAYAATEIRSRFADTMLWKTVTTDAQGRATLEVELADNVTTWRATARACTVDSRFGQETNSVLSRKNIIVRVETPRFLTQNDEALLSAVIHNNFKDEKELRIEFSVEGLSVEGERTTVVRIPGGGRKRFDWKSKARDVGVAKVTAKALGTEDSDAMEVSLPVLPFGTLVQEARAGIVEGRIVEKVVLPADTIPQSAELTVTVSPVPASMVLDALDSLAGYPYGCVEQTMSRFLPTVAVSQALKKLGISKPKLEAELPRMVASGLQRLTMLEQPEGGWGWWSHGHASGWITAYVVSGLALAHEAGHPVQQELVENGVYALWLRLKGNPDCDESAYILSALSAAHALRWEKREEGTRVETIRPNRPDQLGELRDRLVGELPKMKPYAQALMTILLHREGKDAKPALALLEKSIRDRGTHARIEDSPGYGWLDDGGEATAVALRAFVRIDPKHPIVAKLINGLSLARRGPWWTSTRQSAMTVFALVDYLVLTGGHQPDMTLTITLNGERISAERVTKETWAAYDGVRKIPASKLRPGENVIEIERAGTGSPSYAIALRSYRKQERIEASNGGLQILRRYNRIESRAGERLLVPIGEGEAIPSGEEIEVTLTLVADGRYEWLMLEDPLPAGFEPVREFWGYYGWNWEYWYDHKEFHDQRVSVAMGGIEIGGRTISYTMRAETPGDYRALPSRIYNMYHPEIGGSSSDARIRIVERK